ncbi:MAG: hypothetical protein ABSF99_08480 [Anaerolineales bacterium]|jgi:hypothetical protein
MKVKKMFVFIAILVIAMLAFVPITVQAHGMGDLPIPTNVLTEAITIALGFASLFGISALIAALINLLKTIKVVTDGTSAYWSAGLNLAAFIGLVAFRVFRPDLALDILNGYAGQIATVILFILGFIVQIIGSASTHLQLKAASVPLLGTSFSKIKSGTSPFITAK